MIVQVAQSVGVGPVSACNCAGGGERVGDADDGAKHQVILIMGRVMYHSSCQRLRIPSIAPAS